MLPVLPANIPEPMKSFKQWVPWVLERRDGAEKPTKVPKRLRGGNASVNDARSWATFEAAVDVCLRAKEGRPVHGVGFVLTADDGLASVDLDNCVHGGVMSPWAQVIVNGLDTYTELSPSGTGVRIFARCDPLPRAGINVGGRLSPETGQVTWGADVGPGELVRCEVYHSGHYMTVTGQVVDGRDRIEERSGAFLRLFEELVAWKAAPTAPREPDDGFNELPERSDNEVVGLARNTRNGEKFRLLFDDGDTSLYRGDQSRADMALLSMLAYWTHDIVQLDRLFRRSARMRDKWDEVHHAGGRTYGEVTIERAIGSPSVRTASPLAGADGKHYTDVGNAERLVETYGHEIRYVPRWGSWYHYARGRWNVDDNQTVVSRFAARVGRKLLGRIRSVYGDERRTRELLGWVKRCESGAGIYAMVTAARSFPDVAIDYDDLDAQPHLLNVRNGTVNLATGGMQPHDPADLLTLQAGVEFDPEAEAPTWTSFLERILPDQEVRQYVQQLGGLALLGDTPEHILPILIGHGKNGKSTITTILSKVLGGYSVVGTRELLLASNHEIHPAAKAKLFRRRFAHLGELPPGGRLNESVVKELTGGDKIDCRRMGENWWEFYPSHLLWIHANHKPRIEVGGDGMWRRVALIPFDVQIPEAERVPKLGDKIFATEGAGVLNWMLAGLADYRTNGLVVPDRVRAVTDAYEAESDTVTRFLTESGLEFNPNLTIKTGDLTVTHLVWFDTSGVMGTVDAHYRRVVEGLKERGAATAMARSKGGRYWKGVGVPENTLLQ